MPTLGEDSLVDTKKELVVHTRNYDSITVGHIYLRGGPLEGLIQTNKAGRQIGVVKLQEGQEITCLCITVVVSQCRFSVPELGISSQ